MADGHGLNKDGMIKQRKTYEIRTPETVGCKKTKILLGRHLGKHGWKSRLQELGHELNDKELQKVYELFINLADKKKEVFDEDLRALMGDEIKKEQGYYELVYINVNSGTNSIPTATVTIKGDDTEYYDSATGDGTVDALFNSIDRALNIKPKIESYKVRSVT